MKKKIVTILITCIGRRVSLLKSFRQAARSLGLDSIIIGTDTTDLSAALQCCDKHYLVDPVFTPEYPRQLAKIIQENHVDLLVPTVDLDLPIIAARRKHYEKMGCAALISSERVIKICRDKRNTFAFLQQHGFLTPQIYTPDELLGQSELHFPYFLKPWDGHASRKNQTVFNLEELDFYSKRVPNCLVQEFIRGAEHTIDVLVDFSGKVRCVVPRRRLQVRDGEVSKSVTVKHPLMIEQAQHLIHTLKAGPGVITIQCFLTGNNDIVFIEINPRFGGGVPLSIKAGANFPKWILQFWMGQNPAIKMDGWRDNLYMLRFDEAIWMRK